MEERKDPKVSDVRIAMAEVQGMTGLSCLAVFILTHGEVGGTLHANDSVYNVDRDIVGELLPTKCPNLVGRPKMVFVQARMIAFEFGGLFFECGV